MVAIRLFARWLAARRIAEGGEDEPVVQPVMACGRRVEIKRDKLAFMAHGAAPCETDAGHIKRDFGAKGGEGAYFDKCAGGRHFMDEALNIHACKDNAPLNPRGNAAEATAFGVQAGLSDFRGL